MQRVLQQWIEREARKRLRRNSLDRSAGARYRRQFQLRTGQQPKPSANQVPAYWSLDKHFDPRYCISHSKFLARGIWRKLQEGGYVPRPALQVNIPKSGRGLRAVRIFAIPDAAVSNLFAKNLIKRNSRIFSAFSYAYRSDKNLLDAVIQIKNYIAADKVFLVAFDFQKFFDSIEHTYLIARIFQRGLFLTTYHERNFVRSFLRHRYANFEEYLEGQFTFANVGIPQGATISLFLANAAAHELDLALERRNGVFVRFADDCLVIAYSYEDAIKLSESFSEYSARSGVKINRSKSEGVKILSDRDEEFRTVSNFAFLGYQFSKSKISISEKKVRSIKNTISRIIYVHLLLYPRRYGLFNPKRIGRGFFDWDLVTCINEIRGYIYGGLREATIQAFLNDQLPIRYAKGIMAYYCLVDDAAQLHKLDGWLISAIRRAYAERAKVLGKLGYTAGAVTSKEILTGSWYDYAAIKNETRCPSFFVAWRAARKKFERHGVGGVTVPGYSSFYDG